MMKDVVRFLFLLHTQFIADSLAMEYNRIHNHAYAFQRD